MDPLASDALAHLKWMASMPGAKDHAWFRAKELAREFPQFYGDLPKLLTEAMRDEAVSPDAPRAEGGRRA
jgi:hypothetical protein